MDRTFDLFMFMGQSNMAGRGISTKRWPQRPPKLTEGAGYEYRAVSAPDKLYPIEEPFGVGENNPAGICEDNKTGSMVTSFVNTYYSVSGVPIIGVSASKGGSCIAHWSPGSAFLLDAVSRLRAADDFLAEKGYPVRCRFMLWCQGETDGDLGTGGAQYKASFKEMLDVMEAEGIEKCFLIRIGRYNGSGSQDYTGIMQAQEEIAQEDERVLLVSRSFAGMKAEGLMKDDFHYVQEGYNRVGEEAGKNAGEFRKKYLQLR